MGTIKADSIQPTIVGNNLILRTGSDVERVRISPSGDINVSGSIAVSITGNANFVGNVGVTGSASISQNMTVGGSASISQNMTIGSNMTVGGSATASTAFSAPNTPKAWAIIQNGTTLVAGYNVSSVSSSGGRVYIDFPAGVFPDANWCVVAISAVLDANEIVRPVGVGNTRTATQCELYCTGIGSGSALTQTLAASPHQLVYAVFYHL